MPVYIRTLLAFSLWLVSGLSVALEIGDQAPELQISDWTKGEPVSVGDGAHFFVIELWATWCQPCRESFPRLTALQKKYQDKGVIVVAISDEPNEKVRSFVERHDKEMGYRVATDQSGETTLRYAKDTPGFLGIPFVLVVTPQGKVAWYATSGVGMEKLETVLDSLFTGTYDEEATRRSMKAFGLFQDYFSLLAQGAHEEAAKVGESFLTVAADNPPLLVRFAAEIVYQLPIDAMLGGRFLRQDFSLAQRAAESAYQATEGRDPLVTCFYASILFENKAIDLAIRYQEEALQICQDKKIRRAIKKDLRRYNRAKRRT